MKFNIVIFLILLSFFFCRFQTVVAQTGCVIPSATVINSLPATFNGLTTCGAGNDVTSLSVNPCGNDPDFFGGADLVFAYTATASSVVGFQFLLLDDYGPYGKFLLYENCPLLGNSSACVGQIFYKNSKEFEIIAKMEAGKTYYLLVDGNASLPCFPFNLYVTDCVQPRSVSGLAFDNDSVRINWYLPGNYIPPGGFEWKIGADTSTASDPGLQTGIAQSQETIVTNLPSGRPYKAFVRSICTDTLTDWAVSPVFRTWSQCPENLGPLTVISDFPANLVNQTTCGLGDDLSYLNTPYCATGLGGNINGEDAVYQFVAPFTGPMAMIYTANSISTNALLYEGCPFNFADGICLGTVRAHVGGPELVANISIGKTYYIVVDHLDAGACVENFNLQLTDCIAPTLLDVVGEQTDHPTLYWTVPNNAYPPDGFEWRITADTSGPEDPILLSGMANSSPVVLGALPSARYLHFYLRALCTDGPGRWVVSETFASKAHCPEDLGEITDITTFPAIFNGKTTCGQGDNINEDFSPLCEFVSPYKKAEDVVYTINTTQNRLVDFYMISQQPSVSMSLYRTCPFDNNAYCETYAERTSSDTTNTVFLITGGYTYYLVVDGPSPNTCFDYDLRLSTCIAPQSVGVTNVHQDSASLSWSLPYDPTLVQQGYEWKIVLADSSQNASSLLSGNIQDIQVQLTALPPATFLKAYVRAHCGPDDFSPWSVSAVFKTPYRCPNNLGNVTTINALPFAVENATCGQGNDLTCSNIKACNASSYCNYLTGEDVVYQYTPTEDVCATINFQTPASGSFYFIVFKDCPFEQTGCERYGLTSDSFPIEFQSGHTYYFYLDQDSGVPCFNFNLSITPLPACERLEASLAANGLTGQSAALYFTSLSSNQCYQTENYEWRLLAAGTGPDGTLIATDNTVSTLIDINGLTPGTDYDFYVRSICHDQDRGPWSDLFSFQTRPACPMSLGVLDTIGTLPFQTSTTTCGQGNLLLSTLCSNTPSLPGEDMSWIIHVPTFRAAQIYFRSTVGGATVLLTSGCPLTNSDQNGDVLWCKTFDPAVSGADSMLVELYPGNDYYILIDNQLANNCGEYELRIDTLENNCGAVRNVQVSNISTDKARVSWLPPTAFPNNTIFYEVKLVLAGSGLEQLFSPFYVPEAQLNNLQPGTAYECYVRARCALGNGEWVGPVDFSTLACPIETQSNGVISLMAVPQVHFGESTCGQGNDFDQLSNLPCQAGAGEDILYRLQVPSGQFDRLFFFHFRTQEAGPMFNLLEDCNHDNACITSTQALDAGVYGFSAFLSPGRTYYLLADHPDPGVCFNFDFEIEAPDSLYMASDDPGQAYSLAVGDTCWQHVNTSSTYEPTSEPLPDCMSNTAALGWFTFTAPPSGNITISTEAVDSFSVFDAQLALYAPFSWPGPTSTLLACDDNSGLACFGCSMLSYGGLVPGEQYYIGVAGAHGQAGKFCLRVEEDLFVTNHEQIAAYQQPNVAGNNWVNFDNGTGGVLAALQPNGNVLGEVTIQTVNLSDVPAIAEGAYIVPRMFQISCDGPACGNQFAEPVRLRLIFSDQDLQTFNDSTGLNFSVADLRVFHYDGPQEDGDPLNNATLPVLLPTSQVEAFELGPKSFSIELTTNSFSEFFIGSAGILSAAQEPVKSQPWPVKISPVPVQDKLNVNFDLQDSGPITLDLLLPTGQVCLSRKWVASVGENTISISMRDLPDGLYFLVLRQTGASTVLKVVKGE